MDQRHLAHELLKAEPPIEVSVHRGKELLHLLSGRRLTIIKHCKNCESCPDDHDDHEDHEDHDGHDDHDDRDYHDDRGKGLLHLLSGRRLTIIKKMMDNIAKDYGVGQ